MSSNLTRSLGTATTPDGTQFYIGSERSITPGHVVTYRFRTIQISYRFPPLWFVFAGFRMHSPGSVRLDQRLAQTGTIGGTHMPVNRFSKRVTLALAAISVLFLLGFVR